MIINSKSRSRQTCKSSNLRTSNNQKPSGKKQRQAGKQQQRTTNSRQAGLVIKSSNCGEKNSSVKPKPNKKAPTKRPTKKRNLIVNVRNCFTSTKKKSPARGSNKQQMLKLVLYHGTASKENVDNILEFGWKTTGTCGSTYGHGVYLSDDLNMAKAYARCTGFIIKVEVEIPKKMILKYDSKLSERIPKWVKNKGETYTGITPAIVSAYALQNGYKIINNSREWVLVTPNSAGAEYWRKSTKGRWYRAVELLDANGEFVKKIN